MRHLDSYWRWTSEGPWWHWVAGIGGPLLAVLFIIGVASGGEEEPAGGVSASPTRLAPAVAAASPTIQATVRPATTVHSPATQASPTPPPSATYTVVAGDNPTSIAEKLGVPFNQRLHVVFAEGEEPPQARDKRAKTCARAAATFARRV